jgi:hypothetical protein
MNKILLTLICSLLAVLAYSQTNFTVDGINFTTTGINTVQVSSGGTYSGNVTIRSSVLFSGVNYSVTSIGANAFQNCNLLTNINIPSSINSIGTNAFTNCSSLSTITIPPSITTIEPYAFSNCSSLISITIPPTITTIGTYAFSNCTSLSSITIPSSVSTIGSWAFYNCTSITSITIPSNVLIIEDYTFYCCTGLKTISIPSSVTSIGGASFQDCTGLTSITLPSSLTYLGSSAFRNCKSLSSITIPSSVKSLGNYTFGDFEGLINVDSNNLYFSSKDGVLFNKGLSVIIQCPVSLVGVYNIPTSVTTIGRMAFRNCKNLTSISMSSSVTTFGDGIFMDCSGLTSIVIPTSVTSIGANSFYNCTSLTSLTLPNSVMTIGEYAFFCCSGLSNITIPSSVTSIGNSAFLKCNCIFNVDSNKNYSSKEGVLFNKDFTNLIQCPVSLKDGFIIPFTVKSIESRAFYECTKLSSISIPPLVTSIGEYAFNNCTGLKSIIIPSSITSIGYGAFNNCTGLENLYSFISNPMDLSFSQLSNIDVANCKLYVPIGKGELYNQRNGWKNFQIIIEALYQVGSIFNVDGLNYTVNGMNSVDLSGKTTFSGSIIPTGVTYIGIDYKITSLGNSALEYNTNFTEISVPEDVSTIGDYTFNSCTNLTKIQIPSGLQSIGNFAFYNCTTLSEIKVNTVTPPALGTDVFYLVDKSKCKLLVPSGSLAVYKDALQWKDFLNIVEFVPTEINNIQNSNIKVYPNPTTSFIHINLGENKEAQILKIFNSIGQEVYNSNVLDNQAQIDVSNYSNGLYFIKAEDNNGKSLRMGRFIKE